MSFIATNMDKSGSKDQSTSDDSYVLLSCEKKTESSC